MNDLTQYEKDLAQQAMNLPVPDKDVSWDEMKKLLEEDDGKEAILIRLVNRRKLLFGLFISLFIIGGSWFFLSGINNKNSMVVRNIPGKKSTAFNSDSMQLFRDEFDNKKIVSEKNISKNKNHAYLKISGNTTSIENNITPKLYKKDNLKHTKTGKLKSDLQGGFIPAANNRNIRKNTNNFKVLLRHVLDKQNRQDLVIVQLKKIAKKSRFKIRSTQGMVEDNQQGQLTLSEKEILSSDISSQKTLPQPLPGATIKKDTAYFTKPIASASKDTIVKVAKKIIKKRKAYLAAGLALQQTIDANCNCFFDDYPYTKISLLTNYLPSVYFRIYKNKWFIQAEFKYAAPQNIKAVTYKTYIQDAPLNYITTSYTLKKTYYNQIPISFNYFILPNWSIGAGVIIDKFSSANIEIDVAKNLYGESADSILKSKIITNKEDSNFAALIKNDVQGLFESQYKFRHFSIGARYSFGLEPYIKYTSPFSNLPIQKTNNSLNLFIRYEFWNNKPRHVKQ